jgi:hypothetical protein
VTEDEIAVPWHTVPVSEPVLPGEFSTRLADERGHPVNVSWLLATIAGVSTTEARRLADAGRVTIDGRAVGSGFDTIKPGSLVRIEGVGSYRRKRRPSRRAALAVMASQRPEPVEELQPEPVEGLRAYAAKPGCFDKLSMPFPGPACLPGPACVESGVAATLRSEWRIYARACFSCSAR